MGIFWIAILAIPLAFACSDASDLPEDIDGDTDGDSAPAVDGDSEDSGEGEIDGDDDIEPEEEAEAEPEDDAEAEAEAEPEEDGDWDYDPPEYEREEFEVEFEIPQPEYCPPGQRICYANKLKICNADGMSWTRQLCDEDQICAVDGCYDLICTPGAQRCMDGEIAQCNDFGTAWVVSAICRPPTTCEGDGICTNSCTDATPIAINSEVDGNTAERTNALQVSNGCWLPGGDVQMEGPDRLYYIDLAAGQGILARVTPLIEDYDPAIYIFSDCASLPFSCRTGADNCCGGTPDTFTFTAPLAGRYYIAVDSWEGRGGDFRLKVTGGPGITSDLTISNLRTEIDADNGDRLFLVDITNNGPDTATDAVLALSLNADAPPMEGDIPHRQLGLSQLAAGDSETLAFRFPDAPNGDYNVWVSADWQQQLYDPDRSNNSLGPLSLSIADGVEEYELTLPAQELGRVQVADTPAYYRLSCDRGRITYLTVSVDSEVSVLDPALKLYASDDRTIIEQIDRRRTAGEERMQFVCPETERVRLAISGSEEAEEANRIGSFTLTAAGLSGLSVHPKALHLYPGGERQLEVHGDFGPLFGETEIDITDRVHYASYDRLTVAVNDQGLVTAQNIDGQRTFIFVTPPDPVSPAAAVPVEVSTYVPGDIFLPTGGLPATIPDSMPGGVVNTIDVPDIGAIGEIYVGVSITHPAINHLVVDLYSPSGTMVRLHKGATGGQNLVTIYGALVNPQGPGDMETFVGEDAGGTWQLKVADDDIGNSGRLNAWRLYIVSSSDR